MIDIEKDVPDSIRPYLNEIADRLWSKRAAVMVGAGFSKNSGDFPDWNQLGDIFYEKAYGKKPNLINQKYLSVLKIAEDVQAGIGRPALDNLIRKSVPDLSVDPSDLHVRLLQLPWNDVFTTNYDTLLERASAKVVNHRYEPVINKEDIPYAVKPRIIKLHGSFPSERPFIITEEDYRSFPNEFAPFVNTVQQSLLENTFCLIGFSGDDPNFLRWIGWIRDNLGNDNTQKIYLVGLFNFPTARLQLLARKGIVVVDLSNCEGVGKNDHGRALEFFFEYLKIRNYDPLKWPKNCGMFHPQFSNDRKSNIEKDKLDELNRLLKEWNTQRDIYPGWLILPDNNRERLWLYTSQWISNVISCKESELDIKLCYELVWRFNKCLVPLFSNLATFCENIIHKYWPFSDIRNDASCEIEIGNKKYEKFAWDEIRVAWIYVLFSLFRFYREEGLVEKRGELSKYIEVIQGYLSSDEKAFIIYEDYLFYLFILDLPKAKNTIENWSLPKSQPYWRLKRAAALAEIGNIEEAKSEVNESLMYIRKKQDQKNVSKDLTYLSQEAYAMFIANFILNIGTNTNNYPKFDVRWNDLKGYNCDPWGELNLFELKIKCEVPESNAVIYKRSFDIGKVTKLHKLGGGINKVILDSFQFLRFFENIGLPFLAANHTIGKETAALCLERISNYSSFWSNAILFRIGDSELTNELFPREYIYKYTSENADLLIENYLRILDENVGFIRESGDYTKSNFSVRLARILPEIISRLCCKCSFDTQLKVLNFLISRYNSSDRKKYKNIGVLFDRLLNSLTIKKFGKIINQLLKLDIPKNLNAISKDEYKHPFALFQIPNISNFHSLGIDKVNEDIITSLINEANSNDLFNRSWAVTSLISLFKLDLIPDGYNEQVFSSIWSRLDRCNFPADTNYYKFAFLDLPHPVTIDVIDRFKSYVKMSSLPVIGNISSGYSLTNGNIPLLIEVIGSGNVEHNIWYEEDVIPIFHNIKEWWEKDNTHLNDNREEMGFPSLSKEVFSRFKQAIVALYTTIIPQLTNKSGITNELKMLVDDFKNNNLPILALKASSLHIVRSYRSMIIDDIYEGLQLGTEESLKDSFEAISIILESDNLSRTLKRNTVSILSEFIVWQSVELLKLGFIKINRLILFNDTVIEEKKLEASILKRLKSLQVDLNYENFDSKLSFDEKVELREVIAYTTVYLMKCYAKIGLEVPTVILEWQDLLNSENEFAEIKKVWQNFEDENEL